MSKVIDLKEKKRKEARKKYIIYILLGAICIYIISAIYLIIKTPTDTVTIDNGILTFEESTTGYIIRNEKVVKGEKYKNDIYEIIQEGERVAKGETIFRYYGDNEKEIEEKISKINENIQKALEKEKIAFPSDVKNIDNQITNKVNGISDITDIQKISELKKDINSLVEKKTVIAGESSPRGSYIKKLIEQKEKYEKQITKGSEEVKAPISGVVSYRIDGLEDILTTSDFKKFTEESLENLDLKTGRIVSTNNEAAKVIDNFESYIVAILNSTVAEDAKEGDKVKITLSSGNEVSATVNNITKQESGKTLIVFKVNSLTEELISYRKISCNITWWSYSGLKVPNDAIAKDEDGLSYVIKKTNGGNKKVFVKILKANDKYSIVSKYSKEDLQVLNINDSDYTNINAYDTLRMYPSEIKE